MQLKATITVDYGIFWPKNSISNPRTLTKCLLYSDQGEHEQHGESGGVGLVEAGLRQREGGEGGVVHDAADEGLRRRLQHRGAQVLHREAQTST